MSALSVVLLATVAIGGQPQGTVIDFYSDSCVPCQQMSPIVSRLQRQGYAIKKVNVAQNPQLASQYNIKLLPTFVLIVHGKEVQRMTGATSESQLRRMAASIPTEPAPATRSASSQPPTSKRSVSGGSVSGRHAIALGLTGYEQPRLGSPVSLTSATVVSEDRSQQNTPPRFLPKTAAHEFDAEKTRRNLNLPSLPVVRANQTQTQAGIEKFPAKLMNDPFSSTVRIQMKDGQITDYGTGTIIDSRPGRMIVLTCGHIIRDASRNAKFKVELFVNGKKTSFIASILKADFKADAGLLSVPVENIFPSSRVASLGHASKVGEDVVSIGCSYGQEPTTQRLKITALNPYNGPANIECTGLPVPGRSGGGLFNMKKEIIGTCIGANEKDKRGSYCGLEPIHKLIQSAGLGKLILPSKPKPLPELVALNNATQGKSLLPSHANPSQPFPSSPPSVGSHSKETKQILRASQGAKLTILIEDPNSPSGTRIVVIPKASAKLLADLTGESFPPASQSRNLTTQKRSQGRSSQSVELLPAPPLARPSLKKTTQSFRRFRRTQPTSIAPKR